MQIFVRWLAVLSSIVGAAWAAEFKVGDPVDVLWGSTWYKATVLAVDGVKWKITYEGYGKNWDEAVGPDRIRARSASAPASAAAAASEAAKTTSAPATAPASSLTFPPRPAGKRAGLEGAYLRVESWYFNGSMSLTNQGWFFTKNGRVSLSPEGGFDFKAFESTGTAQKSDGVYWIDGAVLTIVWATESSKPAHYSFEEKDGNVVLDGLAATPVQGFKRGWRADANYEGGASVRGSGSFISTSNSLQLRRDGTFGGGAVGSASTTSAGSTVSGGSSSSTAGNYEFDGYTLTLNHADGRVERRSVFAFSDRDAQGAPEYIWREETMMRRRDSKK